MLVVVNNKVVNLPDGEAKALIQAGLATTPKQRKIHTRA